MILETKGLDTLSLALTKQHIVVQHNLDDDIIQHYMDMSFDTAEKYINDTLTDEVYTSDVDEFNTYQVKYKPNTVELYNLGVLVKEVDFNYTGMNLCLVLDGTEIYDEVKAYIVGKDSTSIKQGRLLMIGTSYKTRENEDFSNMKATSMATEFLFTMNESSVL